jgi:uncharacterized protein involved in exopolysaccharide biosynthesis/Mrp family chromosome partitioning ATPase
MDEQELDLRGLVGLLRRQFRLIVVTVVVVLALAGMAVLVLKPVYTASTLILVDPSRKDLLDPNVQAQSSASDSARVESEVELVKAETTLLATINDLNLVNDPEFGVRFGFRDMLLAFLRIAEPRIPEGPAALQDVLSNLRDAVSVQRRGLTYLISVQVRSLDPERAARVANAIAGAYIREQLQAKIASTLASRDIIDSRIAEARDAVSRSEESFDRFIDNNLETIARETGRDDLTVLRAELEQTNRERLRLTSVADYVDGSLQRQDWSAIAAQLQSEAVSKLVADREALRSTLSGLADGSEQALDLTAELEELEAELDAAARGELTTLRQQAASTQARAAELRADLRSGILQGDLPPNVLTNIYELQQNAELARTQYQTLLSRLQDLETQASLQIADSRIVSEALPPADPSFPNPRLILSIAGVAALGLGIGLAFLVENFIGGFTNEDQLRSVLHADSAMSVPRQRAAGAGGNGGGDNVVADLVATAPLSAFAEAVRRVRIGLDQLLRRTSHDPQTGTVIMVTSAAPSEGKTTMALALARTYSLSGRSTLLIDCDMRKPSIHRYLGLEPTTGLLDYLAEGGETPALTSTEDALSGAHVILGARRSHIATDQLVAGGAFRRLIDAARKNFSVVILDTPPIGPIVDGMYLAQFADVVAFVVRSSSTSQQDARSGFNSILGSLSPGTGMLPVLNQEERVHGSYRYAYSSYYTDD